MARAPHHKAATRWPPEAQDEFDAKYQAGLTLGEIAEQMGCTVTALENRIKKLGMRRKP